MGSAPNPWVFQLANSDWLDGQDSRSATSGLLMHCTVLVTGNLRELPIWRNGRSDWKVVQKSQRGPSIVHCPLTTLLTVRSCINKTTNKPRNTFLSLDIRILPRYYFIKLHFIPYPRASCCPVSTINTSNSSRRISDLGCWAHSHHRPPSPFTTGPLTREKEPTALCATYKTQSPAHST